MACNQLMRAADASGVRHSLLKSHGSEASRFVGCAELGKHLGSVVCWVQRARLSFPSQP